MRYSPLMN